MACNTKQAALQTLINKGLLLDKRVVPMDKLEEFDVFNKQMTDFAARHYNLNIDGNFFTLEYQEANAARPFPIYRAAPVDTFFEQLDINKAFYDRANNTDIQDDYFKPEFSAMPVPSRYTPTNYNDYVTHKEGLLKTVEKRLANALAERKFDKSRENKSEIAELSKIKETLEADIYQLKNSPNIFEMTMSVFNEDINLIDTLLQAEMPAIENIQLAESMVTYFDIISDYSSTNQYNNFVPTDISKIEPDVLEVLNSLRVKVLEQKSKIDAAKKQYLLQAIDESTALKSLFPDKQLEEIRDELLANKSDISLLSMLYGTVDKEFTGQDSLLAQLNRIELERSRDKAKSKAAEMIQTINNLESKAKAKLLNLGYGITYPVLNRLVSDVSYDLFYQKTPNGNRTGRLISKYSGKWFRASTAFFRMTNALYSEAWQAKDYEQLNKLLASKYQWINNNAELIDLSRIPELNVPEYSLFNDYFDSANSQAYKEGLISKIGQFNYNKLVEQQKEYLDDYLVFVNQEQQNIMFQFGVSSMAELPDEAKHRFNITIKRNDPFELIQSHKAGQEGRVDYIIGNSGNQYQSYLKFNSFIPKAQIDVVDPETGAVSSKDSGYFDEQFKAIEQDPDLLAMWEAMSSSAEFMNATLNDASTTLSHNSLLKMSQSITDILLDRNNSILNKTVRLLSETGQTLKNLFSTKIQKQRASDIVGVNKNGIATIESEVNLRYSTFLLALSNTSGKKISSNTEFTFNTMTAPQQKLFEQATGLPINQLINIHGEPLAPAIVKEYFTNQVMEQQTFNLPVMMRAYLDVVSEYKAQKDALPKISIYKSLYDNIKLAKKEKGTITDTVEDVATRIIRKNRETGIEDARLKAQVRMEHWVNKNVKGIEDKEYWRTFGRNLTKGEKAYEKEAKEYLETVEAKIQANADPKQLESLLAEKQKIELILEDIGLNYTLATAYNTVINKLSILVGLGWNIPSQVVNSFQGWWQGMVSDTGRYWTAGNFYTANAFIRRKGLRRLPGFNSYRNEVNKTKLLIEKLDIIQDNTNELDRARRKSGFTGLVKKINPFYLTEYVEWHNQTPQILSMLMDEVIVDKEGNEFKIFDGHQWPAYNIENGAIVLKPEFRTEDNIATWESFSNNKSADVKNKMSSVIALLNGDYSRTGSLVVKSKNLGKTHMMFKTWLPNQIFLRFAKNQTDLSLGLKDFDGAYAGALSDGKTQAAGAAGLTALSGIAALGGLPLGFGIAIPAALLSYTAYNVITNKRNDGENLETLKQLSAMGQAILKKFIGLPINTISGKSIINAYKFDELNITEQEKQNLMFIANEVVGLLWLTLFKVMIKGMLGDDKEDEPKTLDGNTSNPYYPGQLQTDKEKEFYNVMENMITRLIDDSSLYTNPDAMWTTMMHPAGMDSWFKKVDKISDGLKRQAMEGTAELQTGPNAGKNKLGLALGETFIPGIVNEWVQGEAGYFGFKKYADVEWKPGEVMDKFSAFNSDYKLDRKQVKSQRADEKEKLTTYWNKELGIDNIDDPIIKTFLEEKREQLIKQELDAYYPLNMRLYYDEDQEKIE